MSAWDGERWIAVAPSASGTGTVTVPVSRWGWFQLEASAATRIPGPAVTRLLAAPNPFASSTTLTFRTNAESAVRAEVFDVRGARVRTLLEARLGAGEHRVQWDGRDDGGRSGAPGVYFVRVRAGAQDVVRKVVRLGEAP